MVCRGDVTIVNTDKINVRVTLALPTGRNSVMIKGSDAINVAVAIEVNANITPDN